MPRKRKHSSEEEDEEAEEEVGNSFRSKRRAAIAARDRVAAKDSEDDDEEEREDAEEDDDDDEDYEGEEGDEDDAEGDGDEDEEEDEGAGERKVETKEGDVDEEDDEDDGDAEPVDCIEAELEEPSTDKPGYVLRKKGDAEQKLELCFAGEMRDTLEDINEAFYNSFGKKKIPVLQILKCDVIEESDEIYQVDVLEAKFDKAYDRRELDEKEENKDILSENFYSIVKVEGIDKTWATQYFMPEE